MRQTTSIQVQPLQLTIHNGSAMLVADREGWIHDGWTGLYDHDTRYFSTYEMSFFGAKPRFLTAQRPAYNCAILNYTNEAFDAGSVAVVENSLSMNVTRVLDEGFHESVEIVSFFPRPIRLRLIINFECSFETVFEIRGLHRPPPRVTHLQYDAASRTVIGTYRDLWFSRQVLYRVVNSDAEPWYSPNILMFDIQLEPRQTWHLATSATMTGSTFRPPPRTLAADPEIKSTDSIDAPPEPIAITERLTRTWSALDRWTESLADVHTPNQKVQRAFDQTVFDLASLRLHKIGDEWYPAAGVPWFNAIFGRDALVTAIQTLVLGCPFPRAVLTCLGQLQGTRVNRWNDEEPGKIPHEMRVSQLSLMDRIPFNPFYGTVDASLYYVILLSETYRYSGDHEVLKRLERTLDGCLQWAERYGDIDGDGFIEYWMRGPKDYHNQGWKDAGDAVVYPDGSIVPDPIAIVEIQGLYFDALRRAEEIYQVLERPERARVVGERARKLCRDFNQRFWMPDEGFYAFGLDPDKQPIRTIASNPGQLLWTGIVPPDRACRVVERLMADDMFCGWGVRTLSSQNPAYDPLAYQRGSIWPFDNAVIARGLKKYGFWKEVNRIAEGIFAAGGYFAHQQLPELWAGFDRSNIEWPVLYPEANVPQAWSAGSLVMLLQAILGIEPDVVRRRLLICPTLPSWLDDISIRRLRFLDGTIDLRFTGQGTETRVEILGATGGIDIECQRASPEA